VTVGIGVAAAATWVPGPAPELDRHAAFRLGAELSPAHRGVLVTLEHARADRYFHLALPGVLLVARMAMEKLGRMSVTAVVAGTYLALASVSVSVARAAWFRDDRTLWTHETTRSASCREGHANLARVRWWITLPRRRSNTPPGRWRGLPACWPTSTRRACRDTGWSALLRHRERA
jgi:hypothetical protein